jgi:hypothetical protein
VPMYFGGIGERATLDAVTDAGLVLDDSRVVPEGRGRRPPRPLPLAHRPRRACVVDRRSLRRSAYGRCGERPTCGRGASGEGSRRRPLSEGSSAHDRVVCTERWTGLVSYLRGCAWCTGGTPR